MVTGIYNFFSERRDKFRIFKAGLKVAKRKRSDFNHFVKLQFIAENLAIKESTVNYVFIQDIFHEAVFKFNRVEKNSKLLYLIIIKFIPSFCKFYCLFIFVNYFRFYNK